MRNTLLTVNYIVVLMFCFGPLIGQVTIEYKDLFEGEGIILDTAEVARFFKGYCESVYQPTVSEVELAEGILANFIYCNKKIRKTYNRQYGGIKIDGDQWIVINLLNFRTRRMRGMFSDWQSIWEYGFGEFYEKNSVIYLVNLTNQSVKFY